MAEFTLIKQPAKHGAQIQGELETLTFHATELVREHSPGEVTSYPVDVGVSGSLSDVATHYTHGPRQITLAVIHSDTPIGADENTPAGLSDDMRDRLIQLQKRVDIVTLISGSRVYPNMVVKEWLDSRDNQSGQSFQPMITLQQVQLVTIETVTMPDVGGGFGRDGSDVTTDGGARDSASRERSRRRTRQEPSEEARGSLPPAVQLMHMVGFDI